MDDMLSLEDKTPIEMQRYYGNEMKSLRLSRSWTRATLSEYSGVTVASIKRFETTGDISMRSFFNLCLSLRLLKRFDKIFDPSTQRMTPDQLREKLSVKKPRQRGSK